MALAHAASAQDFREISENATCLGCHGTAGFAAPRADGQTRSLFVSPEPLAASVHGKSLRCVDCHAGLTDIPHANVSRTAAEWRQRIPELCATCHTEARDDYANSAHGAALKQGNASVPLCSDCHSAHSVAGAKTAAARLAIAAKCAQCHAKENKSYGETYHGQVLSLGYGETATCSDCHGAHAILRSSDAKSKVSPGNQLQTCRRCHPDATQGFATFHAHATTDDFERYPYEWVTARFMIAIVVSTFGIFWTHSVLWFYREYRDRRARKERPHVLARMLPAAEEYVSRWSAMWRIAHLIFALSFIVLTATGVTLLYPDTAWAPPLERLMGGPAMASTIHKVSAVIMIVIFVWHLVYMVVHIARNWTTFESFGPYSVLPNWQDARDIVAMGKWFFGVAPRPMFDHWNYMQKVDYWAPFWGIAMLAASGMMLWYKELTAAYLPGWVFNVATIVHGEEALLAAFYLFTIHYFVNHWRPDKFPLDNVMFTGSMPLEEFRREYTVEYKRLLESGELKNYLVQAPSRPMAVGSTILCLSLIAVGLVLLAMMSHGFFANMVAG